MTKFPPRETIDEEHRRVLDEPMGVCDCGHANYVHRHIDMNLRDNSDDRYGECNDCMCPHFNLQHMTTQRKYLQIIFGGDLPDAFK